MGSQNARLAKKSVYMVSKCWILAACLLYMMYKSWPRLNINKFVVLEHFFLGVSELLFSSVSLPPEPHNNYIKKYLL